MPTECVFCNIVNGHEHCYKIWEDEKHMAFLSPYPNTKGFTVVITKDHYDSYVCSLKNDVFVKLMLAARKVALLLDDKLSDVSRTGIITEGYGINHAHVKLFPIQGKSKIWRQIKSDNKKYFDFYEGYISSHDGPKINDIELKKISMEILGNQKISRK